MMLNEKIPGYQILPEGFVVVEGQFDVVLAHQIGCTNVVAVSGSTLTDEQIHLMRRYSDTITLAFDGDDAGKKATLRAIETLKKHMGKTVSRPVIHTQWDLKKWDEWCDYTDGIRREVEAEREAARPRSLHELIEHFRPTKKMLEDKEKETRGNIYRLIEEQSQTSSKDTLAQARIEHDIETERKWMKDFRYMKDFLSDKKVKAGTVTPEMIARAKAFPISELIQFAGRDSMARCIFHSDKTPSMKYYKDSNHVNCFAGCGKKDSIDIVRHQRNLSFREAVLFLCGQK